ncbi:hypothetical protein F2P56_009019 [Juglans regia]|uniref:Uncharacterized protein n=1 Tax=Juglans regia TaxID=51240 RepID=A0A833XNK4_JUGRE|nr:hypothetical protein F2P56_009019 [Juglans regia]
MALVEYCGGGRRNCVFIPGDKDRVGWRKLVMELKEAGSGGGVQLPPITTVQNSNLRSYSDVLRGSREVEKFRDVNYAEKMGLVKKGPVTSAGNDLLRDGVGRDVVALKEENVLKALSDMEEQLGELANKVGWLKRCVEVKGIARLGLDHGRDIEDQWAKENAGKGKGKILGREVGFQPNKTQKQSGPFWRQTFNRTREEVGGPSGDGTVPSLSVLPQTTSPKVVVPTAEVVVQAKVSKIAQKGATEASDFTTLSLGPEIHVREEMGPSHSNGLLQGSTKGDSQTHLSNVTVTKLLSELPQTTSPNVIESTAEVVVQEVASDIAQKGATEAERPMATPLGLEINAREEMGSSLTSGLLQGSATGVIQTSLEQKSTMETRIQRLQNSAMSQMVVGELLVGQKSNSKANDIVGSNRDGEASIEGINMQLGFCEGDCMDNREAEPLRMLPPSPNSDIIPDWVLKKVDELQLCTGVSCTGFEEQFWALIIAIEESRLKSATKRERELKRLQCSINYEGKEGSCSRDRTKGRGMNIVHET